MIDSGRLKIGICIFCNRSFYSTVKIKILFVEYVKISIAPSIELVNWINGYLLIIY